MNKGIVPQGEFIGSQKVYSQSVGLLLQLWLGVKGVFEGNRSGHGLGFIGELGSGPIHDSASIVTSQFLPVECHEVREVLVTLVGGTVDGGPVNVAPPDLLLLLLYVSELDFEDAD